MTKDDANENRPRRAAQSTPDDRADHDAPAPAVRPRRSWDGDDDVAAQPSPDTASGGPTTGRLAALRLGTRAAGAATAIGAAASWVNRGRKDLTNQTTQPVASSDTPAPAEPRAIAGDNPTAARPTPQGSTSAGTPAGRADRAGSAPRPNPGPTQPADRDTTGSGDTDRSQQPITQRRPAVTRATRPAPSTAQEPAPKGPGFDRPVAGAPMAGTPAPNTPAPNTPGPNSPAPPRPAPPAVGSTASAAGPPAAAGEPVRPHNPFAEIEDDDEPQRRFLKRREPAEGGRRAASRSPFQRRQQAPLGRRAVQRRNTTSLAVAAVVGLAIIALIVSYVIWNQGRQQEAANPASPTAVPGVSPGPVLTEGMMLTDGQAKAIDPSRTWTTTLNQNGATEQSPGAACIGPQATGQPIPQLTQIRGLTASGNDKTQALHRADAFATPEEAAAVYNYRANEVGGCVGSPLYVEKGMDVKGLGNQSLGVRVVLLEQTSEYHTIILARTGKIVNVVDVVRFGQPADAQTTAQAMAQVINRECSSAVGLCAAPKVDLRITVPPPGGDQPGFLAAGDIPRISVGQGTWRGNAVASRIDIQDGSGCESVDFNTTAGAQTRQQRTYLLRNDPKAPPQFGIDEVVLAMNGANDSQGLADRITQSIESCETRTLVAKVAPNANRDITTPGLGGVPVKGKWYVVNVKLDANRAAKYRVAVLTSGQKVLYLRSNPSDTFDFTDEQWIGVALRAGERATQAR